MTGLQMLYSDLLGETVVYSSKLVIAASRSANLERTRSSGEGAIKLAGVPRLVAAGDQLRPLMKVSGSAPTLLQAEAWREGLAEQADRQLATTGAPASLQQVTLTAQAFLLSTARNAPSRRNSTTTA